jgi:hypothetical protein
MDDTHVPSMGGPSSSPILLALRSTTSDQIASSDYKYLGNRIISNTLKAIREIILLLACALTYYNLYGHRFYILDTIHGLVYISSILLDYREYKRVKSAEEFIGTLLGYFSNKPLNFLIYSSVLVFYVSLRALQEGCVTLTEILSDIFIGLCFFSIILLVYMMFDTNGIKFMKFSYGLYSLILFIILIIGVFLDNYLVMMITFIFGLLSSICMAIITSEFFQMIHRSECNSLNYEVTFSYCEKILIMIWPYWLKYLKIRSTMTQRMKFNKLSNARGRLDLLPKLPLPKSSPNAPNQLPFDFQPVPMSQTMLQRMASDERKQKIT